MALCAVNLAERAEEKIPPSTLVEIHLTAAVGLKTRCGGKLGFLAVSPCRPGRHPVPGGFPGPEPRRAWAPPPVPAARRGGRSFIQWVILQVPVAATEHTQRCVT